MVSFGVSDACLGVLGLIFFVREVIKAALLLVPFGLLLMLTIDFFRGTIGNYNDGKDADVKKIPTIVIRRIIYTVVIFLIPITTYGVLRVIGLSEQANKSESCWSYLDNKTVEDVKREADSKANNEREKTQKLINEIANNSGVNSNSKNQIRTIVSK
ncbi:MAG: hypothetical protein VZS44_04105 [Bacilli bacterium]|nr:hypothetical protein [Bacilli bacterium]